MNKNLYIAFKTFVKSLDFEKLSHENKCFLVDQVSKITGIKRGSRAKVYRHGFYFKGTITDIQILCPNLIKQTQPMIFIILEDKDTGLPDTKPSRWHMDNVLHDLASDRRSQS